MEKILAYLPKTIAEQINSLPSHVKKEIEEIRVRIAKPLEVTARGIPYFLDYVTSPDDGEKLINKIGQYSFYALEEELKRGYITIEGGHRIGLAGKVVLENGRVKAIRHLSSFNIRIAKEKLGVSLPLTPFLYDGKRWRNTLIIGAPQTGKTTLLRDLARIIASGESSRNLPSFKVGIVDERSEIAGSVNGIPQLEVGTRVDVLDACPKAEGMMMLIRSMSPDLIIADEIGREEDGQALLEAMNAGIQLIVTTHGNSLEEVRKRPILADIIQSGVFERYIELSRGEGPGTVASIRGRGGESLGRKVGQVR
ncbi:MAG TPA: stage III sporulation protein AA [Chondromyces sp.]|nr:stage III sporulation protein AA [Chondromyces sp.]